MGNTGNELVGRVITSIENAFSEQEDCITATDQYISDALTSLLPFSPCPKAKLQINSFLRQRRADRLACMSAWALYKDFFSMDDLPIAANG